MNKGAQWQRNLGSFILTWGGVLSAVMLACVLVLWGAIGFWN